MSSHKIREISLTYCKDTLANNIPKKEYEKEIELKKSYIENMMKEKKGNFIVTKETFDFIISKFKKSNKRNYNFIVRAGPNFQSAIFMFCQLMFEEETFPTCFQNTTLHMINKGGKGRREELSNNRFIHSKSWFPCLAEALVVEEGLKQPLINGSSIYQIGGQPGHRAEKLVFSLKSIISKYRAEGKPIIIQTSDIAKFFDKEMIQDAIITCVKRGADKKACRLWYKLNENTRIRVKTGAGLTNYTEAGALVGQGTIGGAMVSQGGIKRNFAPGGRDKTN